ncbi:sodium-dependent transporter [Halarchaeum nitratireducens]|uniref:Sodium-dependent transporter n=1 Tax=Halarchaeum nitratireducens TaxID=489913 RepID=A0A830GCE0_9EURY|nr:MULTISPECIES: sodium-dependent transporter [Halarchaeum]MBP2250534.1 NSS family neurotransmitter:Na+ symporter [Halarchaeum solikamskense]GGN15118.1 sodium-dependent transporter [Halarchaeum nitratireducens]
MAQRETWTSRVGFIFAAVGSAVGLGNIWSFPFQTASNGGAAFLVVYLLAVFLIGFPTMLIEFVIGRRSKQNAVSAFSELGYGNWTFAGAIGVVASFITLSFYSVVGGWVISYIVGSVTGGYLGQAGTFFGSVSSGTVAIGAHAVFMAITIAIVAGGVADGIERATKFMIPAILVLLVGLAAWASTLSGSAAGYAYYLSPDFGVIANNFTSIVPSAMGQAFFTLSLGFGVMIAYASYLGRDDSLPADSAIIVVLNTVVALLAGFAVFPILAATSGVGGASGGAGTAFVALAGAFGQLPAGQIIGLVFFIVLLFAALSSSISLLEAPSSYVVDRYGVDRPKVAVGVGVVSFVIGIAPAYGYVGLFNDFVFNILLPVAVLFIALFAGWVANRESVDELGRGTTLGEGATTLWLWWVRVVIPIVVAYTLYLGVTNFYSGIVTGAYF